MIYSKFSYNSFETDYLKKIDEFIKNNDLTKLERGKHEIDGDNLFVNVTEYATTNEDNRVWEAHKKYVDVHVMIEGRECLYHTFIENAEIGKYNEDTDYLEIPSVSVVMTEINLDPGEYLVFDTADVHKTAIMIDDLTKDVKKAIFKVRI